ncbi:MAG: hypothetical protein V1720_17720 [bacterium]
MSMYFCINPECQDFLNTIEIEGEPQCPRCCETLSLYEDCQPTEEAHHPRGITAIAITALPYGGFQLTYTDCDDTRRWGGQVRTGTNLHVRELKNDLQVLGYYGPARFFSDTTGRENLFDWHLVGAVLGFKYDLVRYLGVRSQANPPFTAPPDNLRAEHPIHYTNLTNPYRSEACINVIVKLFEIPELSINFQQLQNDINRAVQQLSRNPDRVGNFTNQQRLNNILRGIDGIVEDLNAALQAVGGNTPPEPNYEVEINSSLERTEGSTNRESTDLGPMRSEVVFPANTYNPNIPVDLQEHLRDVDQSYHNMMTAANRLDRDSAQGAAWLRSDIARLRGMESPPGNRDQIIENRITHLERLVNLRNPISTLIRKLAVVIARAGNYFNSIPGEEYYDRLKLYGTVDWSTALYIKQIVINGALVYGRPVYRLPIDDEISEVVDKTTNQIIRQYCNDTQSIRVSNHVPEFMMVSIMGHESGGKHTFTYPRRNPLQIRTPILGVDWNNNSPPRRHKFQPWNTVPGPWIWSRGWGTSQFTPREIEIDNVQFHSGLPFSDEGDSDPPEADFIQSQERNIRRGIELYRDKFDNRSQTQGNTCSYSEDQYNCLKCMRRFQSGDILTQGNSFSMLRSYLQVSVTFSRALDVTGTTLANSITDTKPFIPSVAESLLNSRNQIRNMPTTQLERILEQRLNARQRSGAIDLLGGNSRLQSLHAQIMGSRTDESFTANVKALFTRSSSSAVTAIQLFAEDDANCVAQPWPASETSNAEEQYPCSWLKAIILYAGGGRQGREYLSKHVASFRTTFALGGIAFNQDLNQFKQNVRTAITSTRSSDPDFPREPADVNTIVNDSNIQGVHSDLVGLQPQPSGNVNLYLRFTSQTPLHRFMT